MATWQVSGSDIARRLIATTQPTDAKFNGCWKDYRRGPDNIPFQYADADDNTFVIIAPNASDGWQPLAVGVTDIDCDYDCGETSVLVKVLATGEVKFVDGLWEAYKETL